MSLKDSSRIFIRTYSKGRFTLCIMLEPVPTELLGMNAKRNVYRVGKTSMENQVSGNKNLVDDALTRVLSHYKNRPFRVHFAAWLLIGIAFGVTMLPGFSVGSLIGFGISGIVFGILLSLLTYPFSGHYSFTLAGAFVGAAIIPMITLTGFWDPISNQGISACLLVGAIIGGTSSIWQAPLTIIRTAKKSLTQHGVGC